MNREEMLQLADAEMQRAQEILEAQHAYEMEILKAIRQLYKPKEETTDITMRKNMSERDIHFQGFAKLLWDELVQANGLGYIFVDEDKHDDGIDPTNYRLLIAQRAYDLVQHTLTMLDLPEHINDIPDLTQWPVEPDQAT